MCHFHSTTSLDVRVAWELWWGCRSSIENIWVPVKPECNFRLSFGKWGAKVQRYVGSTNNVKINLIRALHDSAIGDILVRRGVYIRYKLYSTSLGLREMSSGMSDLVMFAREANMKMSFTPDCYNLYQYPNRPGHTCPWILLNNFLYLIDLILF